ncbi:MAG TPA: hypothetical protein VJ302_27670 [Blastocatellia bacterium]|nr:hypothetical protein [Blastocatellia bacterium]
MRLFEKGREAFLDGSADYDTDTIKAALLDLNTADTGVKAISGATNATPIVITATGHGFANGDIVFIDGVGGNLAANGLWQIANQATNTFELQRLDGTNVVGSGSYTSGGYAVCLGPSGAGDNWNDFDGCLVGTAQTLANKTATNGVADADDPTFSSVTGATVEAIAIYKDTGTPATSRMIALITGKHIVTVNTNAASSATSIAVEPLKAAIPSGTVLTFSNGQSATLSGAASAGDRSLSVNALASGINAGNVALAPQTGSGLPVTPNGGNITFTIDSGANRLFKL